MTTPKDILAEWEAEAKESIEDSKEICAVNSDDELNWYEMCVHEQRILALISLIRKKDSMLTTIAGLDVIEEPTWTEICAREAIALTDQLGGGE